MKNPLNFKEFIDYPINFQKKIEIQRKSLKSDIEIRIIVKGVNRVSIALKFEDYSLKFKIQSLKFKENFLKFIKREKERDLTQSYDKSPYTLRKIQKAT